MFTLTNIGLVIVAAAWIYQFVRSSVIDKSFQVSLIIYTLGIFLITIDSFMNLDYTQGVLRLVALGAVVGVLTLSHIKARKQKEIKSAE